MTLSSGRWRPPRRQCLLVSLAALATLAARADRVGRAPDLRATRPRVAPPTVGTLRVLALMAQFPDDVAPEPPRALVDDALFRRLDDYIRVNSYGAAHVAGRSTGWVPVTGFSDPHTDHWDQQRQFEDAAIRAAAARGIDFDEYDYVVLINSGVRSFGEQFTVPSARGRSRAVPGVSLRSADLVAGGTVKTYVLVHEFGHAMGLGHAGTVDCGAQVFCAINDATNWREYGSQLSMMGIGPGQLDAAHKDRLGWLRGGGLTTVTADGTFTLEPYETATGGVKALRIPRGRLLNAAGQPAGDEDFIYVEYRQPVGMDANFAGGIVLHVKKDATTSAELSSYPLNAGTPAVDPVSGARIAILSATPAGATVRISGLGAPRRR